LLITLNHSGNPVPPPFYIIKRAMLSKYLSLNYPLNAFIELNLLKILHDE